MEKMLPGEPTIATAANAASVATVWRRCRSRMKVSLNARAAPYRRNGTTPPSTPYLPDDLGTARYCSAAEGPVDVIEASLPDHYPNVTKLRRPRVTADSDVDVRPDQPSSTALGSTYLLFGNYSDPGGQPGVTLEQLA